ncbi:MAG: phosphopantetheine-binding protein [Burkholderiales bacterium]
MSHEIDVLAQYIRDETGFEGPLGADDDLLEAGVLDSFNIVSLAMFAQERFEVEFEAEDLVRENLARLSSLVALIRQRRGENS